MAVSLMFVSAPRVFPAPARVAGLITALLFAATSLQMFAGRPLTPLSKPLPFFAYPFLVMTMLGWAWACRRDGTRHHSG